MMESQPWHFDHHALILADVQGDKRPSELPLYYVPLWARVYDLPMRGRNNEQNAKTLGNKIGVYLSMDRTDVIGINKSLRIRVFLDARKPIPKTINMKMKGGTTEVPVKFEKLPIYFYVCGRLGHGEKDCDENAGDTEVERKYDEHLRASPWKENKGTSELHNETKNARAQALFVTRKVQKESEGTTKHISEVVEKLQEVSLTLSTRDNDQGEGHQEELGEKPQHVAELCDKEVHKSGEESRKEKQTGLASEVQEEVRANHRKTLHLRP